MTDELKPCPFCGDTAFTDYVMSANSGGGIVKHWFVYCVDASCGNELPQRKRTKLTTRLAAIEKWNTRA